MHRLSSQCLPCKGLVQQIFMVDSKGLITTTRGDKLPPHKQQMARKDGTPDMKELKDIVKYAKPHAIVGLAGAGPAFTQVGDLPLWPT